LRGANPSKTLGTVRHAQLATTTLGVVLIIAVGVMVKTASRTTWDGVMTDEQVLDGDAVYQDRCAVCHGTNFEGGDDAPPLVGALFSAVWEGRTLGDLVGRMQAQMPKDAPGSLGRDAYTNIAALLLRRNGFPTGSAKLPSEAATLNAIRYVTFAP
jgi:mono/diheme cytochrome c family protein